MVQSDVWSPAVVVPRPDAVDGQPKRFGWLRRSRRWVLAAVRLAVAPWPVLAPLTVAALLAGPFAVPVMAVVLVAAALRWDRYRRLLGRARNKALEAVLRFQWATVCSLCGFTLVGDRRVRAPQLVGAEFGPGLRRQAWWRLEVIPLSQHDEITWPRYGARLQRQLHFAAHDQVTSEGAGSIVVTLVRDPLPRMLELSADLVGDVDDGGRDRVLLGRDVMGADIRWTPDDDGRGMVLIGGSQGGGKSNLTRSILSHGVAVTGRCLREGLPGGWDIVVVDPAVVDFTWLVPVARVTTSPEAMFAAVFDTRAEIDRRAEVMAAHGVNHWLKLPLEVRAANGMDRRLVLVVDELVALMAMRGRVFAPPDDRPTAKPVDLFPAMATALADVGAMGRKVGVNVVAATQHPIAEHLGPMGSTFKANLGARIGTGALEPEGAGSLFGKSEGADVAAFLASRIPGRFATRGLSADGPQQRRHGQAYYAPDQLLVGLVDALLAASPSPTADLDDSSLEVTE